MSTGSTSLPQRLRHGAALFVERPAVGRDRAIGRLVARADGAEQGRVEPAAMLVAAFEVQIGGPGQAGFVAEHGSVAAIRTRTTRRECPSPCVNFVSAALGALRPGWDEASACVRVPGVGAAAREQFDHLAVHGWDRSAACRSPRTGTPRSARPRCAGARCTSRGGWRSCSRCALRPRPDPISPS